MVKVKSTEHYERQFRLKKILNRKQVNPFE